MPFLFIAGCVWLLIGIIGGLSLWSRDFGFEYEDDLEPGKWTPFLSFKRSGVNIQVIFFEHVEDTDVEIFKMACMVVGGLVTLGHAIYKWVEENTSKEDQTFSRG